MLLPTGPPTLTTLSITLFITHLLHPPTFAIKHETEEDRDHHHCGCSHRPGSAGPPGIPGVPGLHGSRGQDGNKGDKGDSGSKGEIGSIGPIGPIGPLGPPGDRGKKGPGGDKGEVGSKGDKGERGYTGFVGVKGSKGEPHVEGFARVAFSVVRTQKLGPVGQDTTITFDLVLSNVGDSFDVYSSHFICKVNGTYFFTAHVVSQNSTSISAWLMMNSRHRSPLHSNRVDTGFSTGSQSVVFNLKKGDHVWLLLEKHSAILNDYTSFSGFLLFQN
ncbi:hypothetical protein HELRODRAFT_172920 [Helobdella robusta]|uniref:C1q domain-containing protein n=1 Tax=Helobdella robusta TaxID=6412 RepID=T1F648_HELRO|nr:hypothetical protein HELRODRAFT_172920 [Helobdella robusta]ESO03893.1 hypothetical protein HELRODRAFT_172920 [Helobdella robusta]